MRTDPKSPALSLLRRIGAAWHRWRRRQRAQEELACCDPVDVNRMAYDLGMSTGELKVLTRHDKDAADLLLRRLVSMELEPAKIDPALMRDMQRCCSICDQKGLCEHELEDQPKAASWPKYCPNEQTLAALTATTRH